jgi:hypothetical protein
MQHELIDDGSLDEFLLLVQLSGLLDHARRHLGQE